MALSDIFSSGRDDDFIDRWTSTAAADDLEPLPNGEYIAHIKSGEHIESAKTGNRGYRLTFRVIEGEFTNRYFWNVWWLNDGALRYAKRDLAKIEITDPRMLVQPIRKRFRCRCKLVVWRDDQGKAWNRMKWFEVIRVDKAHVDEFAGE